jgi:hypothetical protein
VNFGAVEVVFPADIDGDGDIGIIGSDVKAGALVWYENTARNGTAWKKNVVNDSCPTEQLIYAADIDADGDTDVVGVTFMGGRLYWCENNNGKGTDWKTHIVDSNTDKDYCATHCLRVADMDGDGGLDIVASAGREKGISGINWWQNPQRDADRWARHYVVGSDGEVESVYPADLDGDGDNDLVGSVRRQDGLTWWENSDGTALTWTRHVIDSSYTEEQVVDAADMDNDGDLDIVASSRRISNINWWQNRNGRATEWAKHVMNENFAEAWSAYTADMDGDGDPDVLAVARNAQEVAWFENRPPD